ncbi:MAG TPA: hypothetical protein VIL03_03745 [Clostridia bacterium]|jgi:hypothetical protein
MNTYVIKHNGKVFKGRNITLTSYIPQVLEGRRVTDYIAFGKGKGTPVPNRYDLFERLGAKPAEIIDINTDCQKGGYYVTRKITLEADEFVGEVITEMGFCAELESGLITHCVLSEGVLKTAEPMEIIAVYTVPKMDGLLEGDNPLAKILLGAQNLTASKFTCGYCEYNSIQDALNLHERYPCSLNSQSLFFIECPVGDKPDLIIFYDGIPVLRADGRYYKPRAQQYVLTVSQNGVIEQNIKNLKIANMSIGSVSVIGAIQAMPTNISPDFKAMPIKNSQKIFVSRDKTFLLLIDENQIQVYQNSLGNLVYWGEIVLDSKVSCLDICQGRLAVVCNHSDTPLWTGKRLHLFQIINNRIIKRELNNDLPTDAQAISLEYAGGNNMFLYYLWDGILTGMTFSNSAPTLVHNCSYEVGKANFVQTSYRRNVVFATDFENNLNSTIYKGLLSEKSISTSVLIGLKNILPDQMCLTGELLSSLNSQTKEIAAYSYLADILKYSDLYEYLPDIAFAFLDGRYIIIADRNRNYKILSIDYHTAEPVELAVGTLPCDEIDQAHIMCDILLLKSQDKLYFAPIQSDQGWIYSDQFAYGDQVNVRFSDILPAVQSGYDACAAILNVLIA